MRNLIKYKFIFFGFNYNMNTHIMLKIVGRASSYKNSALWLDVWMCGSAEINKYNFYV